jgi:hypothetical protein
MSFGFGTRFTRFSTGGAPPAPPFTPADLFSAGQQGVWYDFTDPAYIFANTAGTIPATDGGTVLRANDRSGNGNHWITVAGGQNAIYTTTSSAKSLPCTVFQGSSGPGYGVTASAIGWGNNAVTILCAYEIVNFGAASTMLASSQTVTSTNGTFVIRSPVTGIGDNIEAAVKQNLGSNTAGYRMTLAGSSETLVFCSVINNGGANKAAKLTTVTGQSPSFIKNNTTVPAASLTSTGSATTTGSGNSISTQVLVLGAENTTAGLNPFSGYLYGVIIRAGILTPTEITNTSAWLNAKCNAYV